MGFTGPEGFVYAPSSASSAVIARSSSTPRPGSQITSNAPSGLALRSGPRWSSFRPDGDGTPAGSKRSSPWHPARCAGRSSCVSRHGSTTTCSRSCAAMTLRFASTTWCLGTRGSAQPTGLTCATTGRTPRTANTAAGNRPSRLEPGANILNEWLQQGDDVYAYFNNDYDGDAVRDAQWLAGRLPRRHTLDRSKAPSAATYPSSPYAPRRTWQHLDHVGMFIRRTAWSEVRDTGDGLLQLGFFPYKRGGQVYGFARDLSRAGCSTIRSGKACDSGLALRATRHRLDTGR